MMMGIGEKAKKSVTTISSSILTGAVRGGTESGSAHFILAGHITVTGNAMKCFESAPGDGDSSGMPRVISRRRFATLAALGFSSITFRGSAVEPFVRKGESRLRLSLAAYSFRQYFKEASHSRTDAAPVEQRIDLFQFIDYCAEQNCDAAELTSYYFPGEVTTEFLLKLKRHAFLRGMALSGTAVGNTFTYAPGEKRDREIALVKMWIRHAAVLGIPFVRVFAGNREGQTEAAAKKNCIGALEECCAYAADFGIFLGLENHGGIVAEAEELLDIIKSVQSPWLGINLDTANFHTANPYRDLERCAPFAVNVQVKTEIQPKAHKKEATDLKRIVEILRAAKYQGYLVLEYEAAEDPYKAVPRALNELRALL
jgi:sugar phosphate isomerase/epimerase